MRFPKIRKMRSNSPRSGLVNDGYSARQVTAMVLAMTLAVVLIPAGARAASALLNVVITDPSGANKAQVDANGNLQVSGNLNVANTPNVNVTNTPSVNAAQSGTWNVGIDSSAAQPVSVTSADDPGRSAFDDSESANLNSGEASATVFFTVPSGKRLVIRFVSGLVDLPTGQKLIDVEVFTQLNGGFFDHRIVPTFTGPSLSFDEFEFGQEAVIFADTQVAMRVTRNGTSATGAADLTISGYLIDCSGVPCK